MCVTEIPHLHKSCDIYFLNRVQEYEDIILCSYRPRRRLRRRHRDDACDICEIFNSQIPSILSDSSLNDLVIENGAER